MESTSSGLGGDTQESQRGSPEATTMAGDSLMTPLDTAHGSPQGTMMVEGSLKIIPSEEGPLPVARPMRSVVNLRRRARKVSPNTGQAYFAPRGIWNTISKKVIVFFQRFTGHSSVFDVRQKVCSNLLYLLLCLPSFLLKLQNKIEVWSPAAGVASASSNQDHVPSMAEVEDPDGDQQPDKQPGLPEPADEQQPAEPAPDSAQSTAPETEDCFFN